VAYDTDISAVVKIYSVSLLVFSISTIFSGQLQLIKGPRVTTLIGATLYTLGIFLSSLEPSVNYLYITYGVLAGAGVGFIYVNQLSTLVKWFPNHKGLITGVATSAFAVGAIIFKEIITNMFDMDPSLYTKEVVSSVFLTLSLIYGVMTFTGALLLEPPKNYQKSTKVTQVDTPDFSTSEMLKTPNFWKLLLSDLFALMP
jgi:MFS transporter, OFA family, oxalate/formate antiporter